MSTYEKLKYNPLLKIKGYEELSFIYKNKRKEIDTGTSSHKMFTNENLNERYVKFKNFVLDKINKHEYLPIYRMADGEFMFCLNYLENPHINLFKKIRKILGNIKRLILPIYMYDRKIKKNYSEMVRNIFSTNTFFVAHGENYNAKERNLIKDKMVEYLKFISEKGILGLEFSEYKIQNSYSSLFKPLCDWFDRYGIELNYFNYIPFYFVYVLLNDLLEGDYLHGKKLLIITNYDDKKEKSIKRNLEKNKLNRIDFYKITDSKSFFEKIDLEKINKTKYDLILIGAGIGTINILKQLTSSEAFCVDAGIIIECLANPQIRNYRIFLKKNNNNI